MDAHLINCEDLKAKVRWVYLVWQYYGDQIKQNINYIVWKYNNTRTHLAQCNISYIMADGTEITQDQKS